MSSTDVPLELEPCTKAVWNPAAVRSFARTSCSREQGTGRSAPGRAFSVRIWSNKRLKNSAVATKTWQKNRKMWRSQEHPKTIQKHLHMILKELKVTMREVIFVRMMNWGILPGRTLWTRFNTSQGRGQEELNTNTYESIELCRWPSSRRGSNNKYDKLPARNPRNYQIGLDAFPKKCKLVMVASWDLLRVY